MPELPEVETIRRGIAEKLIGKKIKSVNVRVSKLFIGSPGSVIGAKIIAAKRVAKVLEIVLDNGYSIVIHLKMTGQLIYKDERSIAVGGHSQRLYDVDVPHAYTHIIYEFDDGSHLYFNDFRKFGWNRVVKTGEVAEMLGPDKYGPEPLTPDFTVEYLKRIFGKSGLKIKQLIMDQAKISGVGNIYANDGLYWAEIMPTRPAKTLNDEEITKLKAGIEKVLRLGLESGGSSENTYVNIEGQKGKYMDIAAVYQQKEDPKGHPVKRMTLGGRGTFYCEICQK